MKKNKAVKFILIVTIITGVISLALMLFASERQRNNQYVDINWETIRLDQLREIKDGDPIAIVETSIGEIRFVLYPQYSPEAVANFTKLAESGYYDGTYVFDAQQGAYSGLGAKDKNGGFDETQPYERIPRELHQNLWTFRGAVTMVQTDCVRSFKQRVLGGGDYYCGSRFNIMNSILFTDEKQEELKAIAGDNLLSETYIKKGGIPNMAQTQTVIGQTYKGLDVVDALASLESKTNGLYMTPTEDVIIKSVKITTYSSEEEEKSGSSGAN